MSTSSKRPGPPKNGLAKAGPSIVQVGPKVTQAIFRQRVSALVQRINQVELRVSAEYEALHDLLVDEVCGGNPRIAMDPDTMSTPELVELRARAGHSLRLRPDELLLHLKIAGVSRIETEIPFSSLPFSKKKALLSLATDPGRREAFKAIVARAAAESVGLDDLERAVASAALPPRTRGGRPRGPGPAVTLRHVEGVTPLADPDKRAKVVARLKASPKRVREAFRKDVAEAIEGLQAMLDELDG